MSLVFALETNRIQISSTNENKTLSILESLGFALGISLPLGIITTLEFLNLLVTQNDSLHPLNFVNIYRQDKKVNQINWINQEQY